MTAASDSALAGGIILFPLRGEWQALPEKLTAPDEIRLDTRQRQNAPFMIYTPKKGKDKLVGFI